MGAITDYFRATTDAAIVTVLERADGTPLVGGPHPAFDGVEAKGVDPDVVLGRLIAAVRDTLADLPAADVPAVAARWAAGSEELPHADAEDLHPLGEALSALAHRARSADEDLYCLVCP
ncbi:hypothetical protein [Kitasatospora purpeofusca]|uniref:hypothetical protein n=1 Tax=Kitasatospora purpeofusca TaxID=67352 RepID=UPI003801984D